LKQKGEVIIGLSYSPENIVDENEGVLVMRSSNVQEGKPAFTDNVYVNSSVPERLRLKLGDILICSRNGSRNLIGKNCLITKDEEGMTFGVFMTIYRSKFYQIVFWILNSPVFESQSGLFLTSTINQLTVSTLENMVIPFVESEEEQQQIVTYLDQKTKEINDLIASEKKRIELLKEYRQSLISELVTGKIKVANG
jgi:type I restriction enzyme S subunit